MLSFLKRRRGNTEPARGICYACFDPGDATRDEWEALTYSTGRCGWCGTKGTAVVDLDTIPERLRPSQRSISTRGVIGLER